MNFSCISQHDRIGAIVMISKHWNNQYCHNRLILENYMKITKIEIMS